MSRRLPLIAVSLLCACSAGPSAQSFDGGASASDGGLIEIASGVFLYECRQSRHDAYCSDLRWQETPVEKPLPREVALNGNFHPSFVPDPTDAAVPQKYRISAGSPALQSDGETFSAIAPGRGILSVTGANGRVVAQGAVEVVPTSRLLLAQDDRGTAMTTPLEMVPMGQVLVYCNPVGPGGEPLAGGFDCSALASKPDVVRLHVESGVLSVNGFGRGSSRISVSCPGVSVDFDVVVK
jgi:hypothetical protein